MSFIIQTIALGMARVLWAYFQGLNKQTSMKLPDPVLFLLVPRIEA
jgi:hypothetical protein